jgi:hypothetical protein
MFCKVYNCTMSEESCVLRRRNALNEHRTASFLPGYTDYNCRDCKQGAKIAARLDPKAVKEYSAGLKAAKESAIEFAQNNPTIRAEKIVTREPLMKTRKTAPPDPPPKRKRGRPRKNAVEACAQ